MHHLCKHTALSEQIDKSKLSHFLQSFFILSTNVPFDAATEKEKETDRQTERETDRERTHEVK